MISVIDVLVSHFNFRGHKKVAESKNSNSQGINQGQGSGQFSGTMDGFMSIPDGIDEELPFN